MLCPADWKFILVKSRHNFGYYAVTPKGIIMSKCWADDSWDPAPFLTAHLATYIRSRAC